MISFSGAITILVVVVFIASLIIVGISNCFLKRDPLPLLFSTSVIGTFAYILFFFAFIFSVRAMVRFLHGPHADVSMDFMTYVLVLPAIPAVFCMVAWQVLVYRRRSRIRANE